MDTLNGARQTVTELQAQLVAAQNALAMQEHKVATQPVQEYLQRSVQYKTHMSDATVVAGPGFPSFTVLGRAYPLGLASIPMAIVNRAYVLDLSEFFRHLFETKVSNNIFVQMAAFLTQNDRWATLRNVDLFVTPINVAKRDAGHQYGLDMPHVVFAFAYLVTRHVECVFLDANYTGCDSHANIIHLSHAMRRLFDMKLRVATAIQPRMHTDDSLSYVFYMREGGIPDEQTRHLIYKATGTRNIMQVRVAPGKYNSQCRSGYPNWSAVRDRFPDSCAMILHTFSMLDRFAHVHGKRSIQRIFFVLDSFGAYALYLSIAIKAYGLEQCTVLLTYLNGQYSHMPLA